MMLETPVERAPAESQHLGGLAHVAAVAFERLPDQDALDLLERQVLEPGSASASTEPQIGLAKMRALRQQHRALDGVVELPHVARPPMRLERCQRLGLEPRNRLAV